MDRGANYTDKELLALAEAVNARFEEIFSINKGAEVGKL